MKYQVISVRKERVKGIVNGSECCIDDFTIIAETKNEELARKLQEYWMVTDKECVYEIHPIMDSDEEITNFLNKNAK